MDYGCSVSSFTEENYGKRNVGKLVALHLLSESRECYVLLKYSAQSLFIILSLSPAHNMLLSGLLGDNLI